MCDWIMNTVRVIVRIRIVQCIQRVHHGRNLGRDCLNTVKNGEDLRTCIVYKSAKECAYRTKYFSMSILGDALCESMQWVLVVCVDDDAKHAKPFDMSHLLAYVYIYFTQHRHTTINFLFCVS